MMQDAQKKNSKIHCTFAFLNQFFTLEICTYSVAFTADQSEMYNVYIIIQQPNKKDLSAYLLTSFSLLERTDPRCGLVTPLSHGDTDLHKTQTYHARQ